MMARELVENCYLKVIHEKLCMQAPDLNGSGVRVWTIKQDQLIRINLVEMSAKLPRHQHPDATHSIMVLKGKVEVEVANEVHCLGPGDFLSIEAGVSHSYLPITSKVFVVSMDAPYYDPSRTVALE